MPTPQTIPRPKGLTARDQFLALAQKFTSVARHEGLRLVPFSNTNIPFFARLSAQEQEYVIWKVHNLIEVCESLQSQGKSADDARALTAEYLNHVHITPPTGLLENLKPSDVVDVYTNQHQMVFATLGYFKTYSYSLEEFFCRPWTELYASDTPYVQDKYKELAQRILSGEVTGLVKIDSIPNHVAFEVVNSRQLATVAIPKFAAPLIEADGQVCGYLLVHELAPLGRSI